MTSALSRSPSRSAAVAFVLAAGVAFSIASPLARWARPMDPFVLATGRLVVAAVVLGAFDRLRFFGAWAALDPRRRATVLLAGALLAAHFACFLWGLDHTSLPATVSLVSLEPVSVVLTAWAILGVAPSRGELAGVALATVGAIVVGRGAGAGEHRLVGDLAVVGAVVLYGLYLTVARALKDALSAASYVGAVYTSAAVFMGLAAVWSHAIAESPAPAWTGATGVLAILGLGLVPTVFGHSAVQSASRVLPPGVVALVSPLESLGGMALSAVWLRATPSGTELAGAMLILAGTAFAIVWSRDSPSTTR